MSAPADLGKVGVLMGGLSAEREISLRTGKGVLEALRSRGIDAHPLDPAEQSMADLAACRFDRVFIALHGRFGEDGTIQGALELLGIPYTGSGVAASAIAIDKIMTKRIWQTHGLPTPRYRVLDVRKIGDADLDAEFAAELAEIVADLGLPLIVKAPHEGSTIGVVKVESASAIEAAVAVAAQYDDLLLFEQFIEGRELTVTILDAPGLSAEGPQALPIIEIVAPQGNYDYRNKYFTNDTRYLCPAPIDPMLARRIQDIAVRAFSVIGCEGWGRVDLMLRAPASGAAEEPFLLEINTSPGMTDHSLVPMAAKAAGMSYAELAQTILEGASLKVRRAALPSTAPDSTAGSIAFASAHANPTAGGSR